MKRTTRHVCTECGHVEIRALAPTVCPNCDSHYLIDDEILDEEMDDQDVVELLTYHMKSVVNG